MQQQAVIDANSAKIVSACRQHMVAFMHKCHAVTERIMSCFAAGLGLSEDYFKEVSLMCSIMIVLALM